MTVSKKKEVAVAKKSSKKNLYMMTLGCPKNRVDSEVMLGSLQHKGYTLVQEPETADVIVVNTCAFLKAASCSATRTR